MDLKTLEGKILANRSSIRQIRQCFPPPTFRAIRYVDTKNFHYTVRTLIHFTGITAHSMILHSFLETGCFLVIERHLIPAS